VLLHLCVAAVIAVALHRAVINRPIALTAPFVPVQLSEAVLFPAAIRERVEKTPGAVDMK